MRIRLWPAAAAVVAIAAGACGITDIARECPVIINPAVEVEVRDSLTNEPAAFGVTSLVTDGEFSDSLRVVGWTGPEISPATAHLMAGAWGRPGNYTVRIDKPGYRTWQAARVRARRGECGVRTAELKARLQRAP